MEPAPGSAPDCEYELGVPIPGRIVRPELWTRTGIKRLPESGPLDWEAIFGRRAPVILDLGCGNGRFTLASAVARPECDHFAIDVLPVVIRYATRRGNQRGLSNARFAVKDAETLLARYVPAESVAEIHLYHPQPHHDPRAAGKRLLTPEFLLAVHRALEPGGLFVVQTDNPDYWTYMARAIPALFDFEQHPEPWPDAPAGRTRREILARSRGFVIFRGVGCKRDDLDTDAARARVAALPLPRFRSRGPWLELDRLEREQRD